MRRVVILVLLMGWVASAQEFRVGYFDGSNVTVQVPSSFDGAYLFLESCSNLIDSTWEAVDYTQVDMTGGSELLDFSVVHPEQGEEVGSEFNSILSGVKTVAGAFYRVAALSFIDSDGDGKDNVSEYRDGTSAYSNDAPVVTLPLDNGDPRPVPGSVNSSPGDWNTRPKLFIKTMVLHGRSSTC